VKFSFRFSFYSGFKCWLNRFGLSFSALQNQNRIELEFFLNILISLIGFFSQFGFFCFLDLISLFVFLLTPNKKRRD
jgi:hypothetical protein